MDSETIWLAIGFLGQGLFSARFLVQWLKSEREKKSVFPVAFWYFSIAGGVTLLSYAIHKQDPVFILGQATGLFIYFRNLYFIIYHREDFERPDEKTSD
ncbi:lipid-A-disaccharide synthase N-terminal domain-containing protein [methane-oxidizing endosymbiont of Gigantopelta aegis]|uniref:lipid-A-disaccharide synthase N-terminal domain-containing protein n=1 Tax=methane-oxidizing endosymbiont of Gigantopelta aegis TaxID=2794938 RepID=UPI0018DCCA76|nr:lipid-A-disaccharide synthase N-terminal domain-containing protein [methane-oxidizing endosymbiont of Gigantopelta aegis]